MNHETTTYDKPKRQCIICDIDGTISNKTDRDIYDYTRVKEDLAIEPVLWLIKAMRGQIKVVFVTGRTDDSRKETTDWLNEHGVAFYELLMRKTGDYRPDTEVKQEILDNQVKPRFDVLLALEDRKSVKRMYVENNIFVLDANQTDTEF